MKKAAQRVADDKESRIVLAMGYDPSCFISRPFAIQ